MTLTIKGAPVKRAVLHGNRVAFWVGRLGDVLAVDEEYADDVVCHLVGAYDYLGNFPNETAALAYIEESNVRNGDSMSWSDHCWGPRIDQLREELATK